MIVPPGQPLRAPNILIVKMWALGDILMATPLLRALKTAYPGCRITWLVNTAFAAALEENPLVNEVLPFDSGQWRRSFRYGRVAAYLSASSALRRQLLARRFDAVINLTAEKWWSVWFGVAPVRVGLFPRGRPGLIGRLYTSAIPRTSEPFLHNTQHYLLPAAALGITGPYDERMVVGVSARAREEAEAFLISRPQYVPGRPVVILHPGSSQASKCWPLESFAAVASRLGDCNVVATGSPSERALCDELARRAPGAMIAAGALPAFGQTVALVERAAAVVTGDTSILHVASALDVPLVAVYGSTRPRDNAPLFGRSVLLYDETAKCAPCYRATCPLPAPETLRCLSSIRPDHVIRALARLGIAPPVVGPAT